MSEYEFTLADENGRGKRGWTRLVLVVVAVLGKFPAEDEHDEDDFHKSLSV